MKATPYAFFTRELSWLSFNERVLSQATAKDLSTYERLKFLAIFASNLNEFIQVRIPGIRALAERKNHPTFIRQMDDINFEIRQQQKRFHTIFEQDILPKLHANKLGILKAHLYTDEVKTFSYQYFKEKVFPLLKPVILSKQPIAPFITNDDIYLGSQLFVKSKKGALKKKVHFAFVNVPIKELGRFITFESKQKTKYVLLLEDIIRTHIDEVFTGYIADGASAFNLLRNADFQIEDEYSGDLIQKIQQAIDARQTGLPCRFLYEGSMPLNLLLNLQSTFRISPEDLEKSYGYLRFADFLYYPKNKQKSTEEKVCVCSFDKQRSYLSQIDEKDHILHFPYHSYEHVLHLLSEAALSEHVTHIKITQYRVATNSAIVNLLVNAANNGKKVTVFVEAKARFDEKQNLFFAHRMKEAGINIIYSIPNYKVHAKIILIQAKAKAHLKTYAYVGTGNFNERTAKIYTDHSLFTTDTQICSDISALFDMMSTNQIASSSPCQDLVCSPWHSRSFIINAIDHEIKQQQSGKQGHIIMKMNGLQDPNIITKLYEASMQEVKIELIVRGICCLVPDQEYSKHITLTRLVDQYLEHGRLYWFKHAPKYRMYMGSADLMSRNLDRRIEVLCPIKDKEIEQELLDILRITLNDNTKACFINAKLENITKKGSKSKQAVRAQEDIYDYLQSRYTVGPKDKLASEL